MRPQKYYTKSNWDLIVYSILFILLVFYSFYIKGTCEELGCLAVIVPIIGIMGLSVIEFFINIYVHSKKYHFTIERKIVFIISGIIAVFTIVMLLLSLVN